MKPVTVLCTAKNYNQNQAVKDVIMVTVTFQSSGNPVTSTISQILSEADADEFKVGHSYSFTPAAV